MEVLLVLGCLLFSAGNALVPLRLVRKIPQVISVPLPHGLQDACYLVQCASWFTGMFVSPDLAHFGASVQPRIFLFPLQDQMLADFLHSDSAWFSRWYKAKAESV